LTVWLEYSILHPEMETLLRQIESAARVSLLKTREFVDFGPFCAYFDSLSDLIWLNYAAPVGSIENEREVRSAMRDLRSEFARRGRRLRFEYIQPLWPGLGEILVRHGLAVQAEQPLMICSPQTFIPRPPDELRIAELTSTDDDKAMEVFERVAFEGFADQHPPIPSEQSHQRLREGLRSGMRRAVIGWIEHEAAGVASISPMGSTAELVGVTTLPRFRRRKIASTLSSYLVAGHFKKGGEVAWLSANDAIARAAYQTIGFQDAGIYSNYMAPETIRI
jgi:predicted GNAT family acetyltransferase